MGFGGLSHSCNYAVELERSGYTLQELEQEVDFIRTMGPNAGLPDYSSSYFSEYLFNIDPNMEYRNIRVEDLSLLKELHMKEIDSCEKVLGNRHVVIITLKRALADMLKSRSRFEEAATILAETLRSVDDMMVGMKIQMDIANIYRIQKRAILAEKKTAEVFAGLQETIGAEHSYTLSAGSSLASIWSELGRLKESEDLLDQLISVKKAKFGVEHPSTIETTAVLAAVYYNQMRYVDAERLQTHILQVRERTLGVEHGFTWTSRLNLAAIYCKQNRIKEAEVIELQVLEFRRKQAGSKHYLTLTALSNLAMTYRLQKRWAEEEEALIEVISGRIEVLGPDHPDTMTSIQALANNYLSQRSPHKAEPLLRKMIEGRSRRPDIGPTHPSTLASRTSLAWTFFDQGKHGEAESMQSETIAEGEQALGVLHQAVLHCKRHSAMMFKHLGRLEEAKRVYQDVWQIQMQSRGLTDPDTNQTALHIAEIDELINQSNATRRCVDSCSLT
jgi:tetratricopeptide (TPR) repeat protein